MKVTVNNVDQHNVELVITEEQKAVNAAVKTAITNIAKQVNIPGFRKGKAPRKVLEMNYGKDVILDEAFELLSNRAMNMALAQEKLEPVDTPEIEKVVFEEGKDAEFKVKFVKKPEVTLGEYKGLEATKDEPQVTDEEVQEQLDKMLAQQAKMVVAPEGTEIATDDFAIIDFLGKVDGVAFEGGEGKAHPLQIGSNSFIPGFEDQLIGAKVGDDVEVKVTFPETYFVDELQGKEAIFEVHVHDIKRKEQPELTDEVAKEISPFETVEQLKVELRKKMEADKANAAQEKYNQELLDQAVANATVDIPELMIEQRIDNMIQELDMRMAGRGMNVNSFLQMSGKTMEEFREEYRTSATKNVKTDLVLETIVDAEKLEVTEDDMRFEIIVMAQSFGADPNEVLDIIVKEGRVGMLQATVARKKAASFIVEHAKGGIVETGAAK